MPISLTEYDKALKSLDAALALPKNDIVRDAAIQRFEFSVELAWKTAKKTLGLDASAPRIVIREMASQGIIEDPKIWFEFLEARNLAAHVYNEKIADKVYQTAAQFAKEGRKLRRKLESL